MIDSKQYPGRVDQTRLVGEEGIITIPAATEEEGELENGENFLTRTEGAVSYTHLTLPTILLV